MKRLIVWCLAVLPGLGLWANEYTQYYVRATRLNSQELELYPRKAVVPGVLWGHREIYTQGMIQLKVSCGVSQEITVKNAQGDKVQQNVPRFRVEMYKMDSDNGDWVYSTWLKFPGLDGTVQCKSLFDQALLLTGSNRIRVVLDIQTSGLTHGSEIKSWVVE